MDYKYIDQLLERYWNCETTLEEEEILRSFFSQDNVPVELLRYRQLFVYESREPQADRLGADFDEKMLQMVGEAPRSEERPQAQIISLRERLMPLFKSAAVVAIVLTLGNAAQVAFQKSPEETPGMAEVQSTITDGKSVALTDSVANVERTVHSD